MGGGGGAAGAGAAAAAAEEEAARRCARLDRAEDVLTGSNCIGATGL